MKAGARRPGPAMIACLTLLTGFIAARRFQSAGSAARPPAEHGESLSLLPGDAPALAPASPMQDARARYSFHEASAARDRGRIERWTVKIGADHDAYFMSLAPVRSTVAALSRATAPPQLAYSRPRQRAMPVRYGKMEHTVYSISAWMLAWSDEKPDRDLVLTIADSNRKGAPTMLVEFPDLTMVGAFSKWRERIGAARTAASAAIRRLGRSHHPFRATITGVGFFDYRHNQPGSAPNGFELHPVLSFHAAAGDPAALSRDPGSKRHAAPAS